MRAIFFSLFLILLSACVGAKKLEDKAKSLNFNINCHNLEWLQLVIENTSYETIEINPRFIVSTGSLKPVEVVLDIKNKNGKRHLYRWRPRVLAPTSTDKLYLTPSIFVGTRVSFENLIDDYALIPGEYSVRAYYRNIFWNQKVRQAENEGLRTEQLVEEDSEESWEKYFDIVYPENDVVLISNRITIRVDSDNTVFCQKN